MAPKDLLPEDQLAILRAEHATLQKEIEPLERHGGTCSLKVQQLKRAKLQLRQQIAILERASSPVAIAAE